MVTKTCPKKFCPTAFTFDPNPPEGEQTSSIKQLIIRKTYGALDLANAFPKSPSSAKFETHQLEHLETAQKTILNPSITMAISAINPS